MLYTIELQLNTLIFNNSRKEIIYSKVENVFNLIIKKNAFLACL